MTSPCSVTQSSGTAHQWLTFASHRQNIGLQAGIISQTVFSLYVLVRTYVFVPSFPDTQLTSFFPAGSAVSSAEVCLAERPLTLGSQYSHLRRHSTSSCLLPSSHPPKQHRRGNRRLGEEHPPRRAFGDAQPLHHRARALRKPQPSLYLLPTRRYTASIRLVGVFRRRRARSRIERREEAGGRIRYPTTCRDDRPSFRGDASFR